MIRSRSAHQWLISIGLPFDPKLLLELDNIFFSLCFLNISINFYVQCPTMLSKMEAKMDQLRALVEAADKDKVELLNQLEEERR